MSTTSDLSLPRTAPSVARYHNQSLDLLHVALYTLVDLSDAELDQLQQTCEQENIECGSDPGSVVRIAQPQARFVGQPLRAVFDNHVALPEPLAFDPFYFLVAVDRDWKTKGVLLVALDDENLRCRVDSVLVRARDAGLAVANLQIANEDWAEVKAGYRIAGGNGEEDEEDDDDEDNEENEGGDGAQRNALNTTSPAPAHT
ncbi:hypothetical protein F4677DRAFT_407680 [Neofusicoccum parvum]|uniref:Uncharacterized protein n=1 Tax=Neofusicoccum parvum TaxID=310453 RepID=A0ACB5S641_9PEZI|nr:hypothetical protein F4677DRAFT_407680 [Neofusicoccum parvum]